MAVYIGHDECQVIYVAKNGQQLRVSSIWVGDQQVFPPANRQEIHVFNRATQGYGRADNGTHFGFTVPVPWWAVSMDVVLLGAGEKGRDGTKSFTGGTDGAGGKSGAWAVRTAALTQSTEALVRVGKGASTSPHATEIVLPGVGGQADVRVHDGEGTRTPGNGSTGGTPSPQDLYEYDNYHYGAAGGSRDILGSHPGGGGGGGRGSTLIGNPREGQDGGDGYVWLRFRSAPAIKPGDNEFILRVGVTSGAAYYPLRAWAASIGKTHETLTEITVPMEVIGPSLERLFSDFWALVTIPALDTSQVTNMYAMFNGCHALTSVPNLDTSQVTDMSGMFENCSSLTSIPELDTSQVTNMYAMFYGCSSLVSVPSLNASQATSTRAMFYRCSSLTTIPALDTSQVTNMYGMFYYCSALVSVPSLNASQVTDTYGMFLGCASLESVTLPGLGNGFTTAQTLDMRDTKLNAAAANALMQSLGTPPPGGDLQLPATSAGADTSIATSKNWTVTISDESSTPDPGDEPGDEPVDVLRVGVTSGNAYTPLRDWAVGIGKSYQTITEITVPMEVIGPSLEALFDGCSALTSIPALDTSQVTNMRFMFYGCSALTTIPAMDTSQVADMQSLFQGCTSLTSVPELDTSQVTITRYMFNNCSALESVTLPGAGNAFTTNQTLSRRTLDMGATKLNAAAANALMESLGTPPPGGNLNLPSTATGADTSIATNKNWTVTIG